MAFGAQPGSTEMAALAAALKPVDGYLDPLERADQVGAAFIHATAGGVHT